MVLLPTESSEENACKPNSEPSLLQGLEKGPTWPQEQLPSLQRGPLQRSISCFPVVPKPPGQSPLTAPLTTLTRIYNRKTAQTWEACGSLGHSTGLGHSQHITQVLPTTVSLFCFRGSLHTSLVAPPTSNCPSPLQRSLLASFNSSIKMNPLPVESTYAYLIAVTCIKALLSPAT